MIRTAKHLLPVFFLGCVVSSCREALLPEGSGSSIPDVAAPEGREHPSDTDVDVSTSVDDAGGDAGGDAMVDRAPEASGPKDSVGDVDDGAREAPDLDPDACVTAVDCDDSNVCTTDSFGCDGSCLHTFLVGDVACEDGDACTVGDFCTGGECASQSGSLVDCDDSDACTADGCSPLVGCLHFPVPAGTVGVGLDGRLLRVGRYGSGGYGDSSRK